MPGCSEEGDNLAAGSPLDSLKHRARSKNGARLIGCEEPSPDPTVADWTEADSPVATSKPRTTLDRALALDQLFDNKPKSAASAGPAKARGVGNTKESTESERARMVVDLSELNSGAQDNDVEQYLCRM